MPHLKQELKLTRRTATAKLVILFISITLFQSKATGGGHNTLTKLIEGEEMIRLTLTKEEIEELTHYKLPKKQLQALQQMGIPAMLRPHDNSVCVLRAYFTAVAAAAPPSITDEPQLQSSKNKRPT